ncbi:MAG: phenylacetic acid degradation operon negative regulatory protein PaaX [Pseudomonadales bacterium]
MSRLNSESFLNRVADQNYSCTSMVITVFGDVVSQHGGWIWMGSLINTLGLFGYSERLVRTAVFRLVQQDWLQANKIGRRSYYCFTENAKGHYERAARRIYASEIPDWDGSWTFVTPTLVPDDKREEFRKSLMWQGYNSLVSGMMAHPSAERTSLDETLEELDLVGKAIVFSARNTDVHSKAALKSLVLQKWNLDELAQQYDELLNFYRPLIKSQKLSAVSPEIAFQMRVLLIHDYRRVLLRDPDFPDELLPTGWVGFEVYELVKRLYRILSPKTEVYIEDKLSNAQGTLPHAGSRFYKRFSGIPTS